MKQRKFSVALILALLVSMLVMSLTANAAAKPKLNKTKATINVGKTVQLKLNNNKKKVTWSSSKKAVATVSNKGLVKGVKAGTAKIIAKVGKNKYTCTVTVKAGASGDGALKFTVKNAIYLNGNSDDDDDMTEDLSDYLNVQPASAKVTWKSSKPGVASVDANGVVTAVADGRTKITATANGDSASITVEVAGMGKEAANKIFLTKRNASKYLLKVEVRLVFRGSDGKLLRYRSVDMDGDGSFEDYSDDGFVTKWYYIVNHPSVNMLLSNASATVGYRKGQYNATLGAEGVVPGSLIKMGSSNRDYYDFSETEFPKSGPVKYREYDYDEDDNVERTGTVQVFCSADVAGKTLFATNYEESYPQGDSYNPDTDSYASIKMSAPSDEIISRASGTIYIG